MRGWLMKGDEKCSWAVAESSMVSEREGVGERFALQGKWWKGVKGGRGMDKGRRGKLNFQPGFVFDLVRLPRSRSVVCWRLLFRFIVPLKSVLPSFQCPWWNRRSLFTLSGFRTACCWRGRSFPRYASFIHFVLRVAGNSLSLSASGIRLLLCDTLSLNWQNGQEFRGKWKMKH